MLDLLIQNEDPLELSRVNALRPYCSCVPRSDKRHQNTQQRLWSWKHPLLAEPLVVFQVLFWFLPDHAFQNLEC